MKGTGAVLLFHAEAELPNNEDDAKDSDPGLYSTFLESRPPGMELAAIRTVISVCRRECVMRTDVRNKNTFADKPESKV